MSPQSPGRPPDQVAETHISLLVLTGDRVLKFRKPVTTDFCDFSTLEARLLDCRREVDLNRRLTDDVYLGVGRVTIDEEGPADEAPEPCVVMRRLPADRQLSSLVERDVDVRGDLTRVAARLADFHRDAERSDDIDRDATHPAIAALWAQAVDQVRRHVADDDEGRAVDEVERLARRWLAGRAPLFEERVASGQVCDGHGDLRADNIFCLDDGPRILDCIEFDDRLRHVDVATDVAFLVMDLRRCGRDDDAETFVSAYEARSARALPRQLLDHSVAYWAMVRAKVAHLRALQGDPAAAQEARSLVGLALGQLRRARPRLVLVGGLPGTGKSSLARGLARATGWEVLSSDVVRKELAGLAPTARTGAGQGEGIYDAAHTSDTYSTLLARAADALGQGSTVLLDASWSSAAWRAEAAELARSTSSDLFELRCELDPATARKRLEARAAAGTDASDAGPAVAEAMAQVVDDWPSAFTVDTSGPLAAVVAGALGHLD